MGDGETYDYIIVGAGSAGSVLAHRLTAAPATDVLLVEAGDHEPTRDMRMPAGFPNLYQTDTDWEYYTEPQPQLAGRELYWPRGKAVGGTSAMNAMIHVRGHPDDYDAWAATGNTGWAYEDILPYFKRSETYTGTGGDPTAHGTDGPLPVTDQVSPRPPSHTFVEAATEIGYDHNPDFNSGDQHGFGLFDVTQRDGRRVSVADTYLTPVLDRPNLTLQTNAYVHRIRIHNQSATGITYHHADTTHTVDAREEVLLCAGAINSPQLLLLSGIGPRSHLQDHDITVHHHLPGVGRNLQDHLAAPLVYDADTTATLDAADSLTNLPRNLLAYYLLNRGPLTSNIGEAGGFLHTDSTLPAPDVEIVFVPAYMLNHGLDPSPAGHGFTVGPVLLRPESSGRVTLRSSDPTTPPRIDPQHLTADGDLETLIEGVYRTREIMDATAFDASRGQERRPGTDATDADAIEQFVRRHAHSLYHPVGTAKMGTDELSVVDEELRVHGIDGVRVIDASVMPSIIRGHTNAPTLMIAEKAADYILDRTPP